MYRISITEKAGVIHVYNLSVEATEVDAQRSLRNLLQSYAQGHASGIIEVQEGDKWVALEKPTITPASGEEL